MSVDDDKVMTDELDTDSFFPPLAEKRIEWNSQWFCVASRLLFLRTGGIIIRYCYYIPNNMGQKGWHGT
jgi:hypothetical protein